MGVVGSVVGGGVFDDVGGVGIAVVGDDAGVVAIAFGVIRIEQILGRFIQKLIRNHRRPFFSAA